MRSTDKWKSESEKMQLMKKLYFVLLKREKVKIRILGVWYSVFIYFFIGEVIIINETKVVET